jgi:lysophospholipid acyltransferase (LPLAT)-like uncharacterized protein
MKKKEILGKIAVSLLNFVSKTWRYKVTSDLPTSPSIIIFWHESLLASWKFLSKFKPIAVVSPSKDGELLTKLLAKWGCKFIRGSSDKQSKQVLQNIQEMALNNIVTITPDGPRGPKRKLKAGAVVASFRTQVPIQYLTVKVSRKYFFKKSWDNFQIPMPFSKIFINLSTPILINANSERDDIDNIIQDIESKMQ